MGFCFHLITIMVMLSFFLDPFLWMSGKSKKVEPTGRVYFPFPDLSRKIERDSAGRLGYGGPSGKIMEIPGCGGSNMKPSGMENPVGWGFKLEKTLCGGRRYGYFLELHNLLHKSTQLRSIAITYQGLHNFVFAKPAQLSVKAHKTSW